MISGTGEKGVLFPRGTTTPISPGGEPEYQQLTRSTQTLHKSTQGSSPWRYKIKYLRASLMLLGATLRKHFLSMPVSHPSTSRPPSHSHLVSLPLLSLPCIDSSLPPYISRWTASRFLEVLQNHFLHDRQKTTQGCSFPTDLHHLRLLLRFRREIYYLYYTTTPP